jgi:lipoate-protein ligase A
MALDEALMRRASREPETTPWVLRFYRWSPPCLSLGRHQCLSRDPNARLEEPIIRYQCLCAEKGIDLVRRATGGRAILHYHELTYSLVVPEAGVDVVASYRALSEGLRLGLRRLGLEAEFGHAQGKALASRENCFSISARADLLVDGVKVVGSAQMRTAHALLQHGSIPVDRDAELERLIYGVEDPAQAAPSLRELLGRVVGMEEMEEALLAGFTETWGVAPAESSPTPDELLDTHRLMKLKYARDAWTWRGDAEAAAEG